MEPSAEVQLATVDLAVFGRRLRETRRTRAMTQEDLAGSDFTAAYVSRIESGQRRPEPTIARLLAERLGTTLDFLVTGVEPRRLEESRLALRYAELALKSGEATDAEHQLRQLLADPDSLGSYGHEAARLHAFSLEALGQYDEAIAELTTLTSNADGSPDLLVAIGLCRIYRDTGDIGLAIEVGERAQRHATEAGLAGTDDEIRLTVTLVMAFLVRGDLGHAATLCREVIARAEKHASPAARGAAYWNASILASKRHRHGEAIELAERALALLTDGDDSRNLARLHNLVGLLSMRMDEPDLDAADRHLHRALEGLQASDGSPIDIARVHVHLARRLLMSGDRYGAIDEATVALDILGSTSPTESAEAHSIIGQARFATGDQDGARQSFLTAAAQLTGAQADRDVGQVWFDLGGLLTTIGDTEGASDAFRRAAVSLGLRPTVHSLMPRGAL